MSFARGLQLGAETGARWVDAHNRSAQRAREEEEFGWKRKERADAEALNRLDAELAANIGTTTFDPVSRQALEQGPLPEAQMAALPMKEHTYGLGDYTTEMRRRAAAQGLGGKAVRSHLAESLQLAGAERTEKQQQAMFDAATEYQESLKNPTAYVKKLYDSNWNKMGEGEHAGNTMKFENIGGKIAAWAVDEAGNTVGEPKIFSQQQVAQFAQQQFLDRVGAFKPEMLMQESQFARGLAQKERHETAAEKRAARTDETTRRGQDITAATARNAYSYLYGRGGGDSAGQARTAQQLLESAGNMRTALATGVDAEGKPLTQQAKDILKASIISTMQRAEAANPKLGTMSWDGGQGAGGRAAADVWALREKAAKLIERAQDEPDEAYLRRLDKAIGITSESAKGGVLAAANEQLGGNSGAAGGKPGGSLSVRGGQSGGHFATPGADVAQWRANNARIRALTEKLSQPGYTDPALRLRDQQELNRLRGVANAEDLGLSFAGAGGGR